MGNTYVAKCECRICMKECISVFPVEVIENDCELECPKCGNMALEAVEYFPPGALDDPEFTGAVKRDGVVRYRFPDNVDEFLDMISRGG